MIVREMTLRDRRRAIGAGLIARQLDLLVTIHDGVHSSTAPNRVMILTGFKSAGPAAAILDRNGAVTLVVTPASDAKRAAETCPDARIVAVDDVIDGLKSCLAPTRGGGFAIGMAGLALVPWGIARPLIEMLPTARALDAPIDEASTVKTELEIAYAREAARIAELVFRHLLAVARPGITDGELADSLKWHGRILGAEDIFVLLTAGPLNRALAPSEGRRLQAGDILLAEITPCFRGQLAQICRTVVLGTATAVLAEKYRLVTDAMRAGLRAAKPGAPIGMICRAMNARFEAAGYAMFCRPPYAQRRGHGLGFGSIAPGDISADNDIPLAPGMMFTIESTQYLPETGCLLCGEPVVMTHKGAEPLTRQRAVLAQVAV